MAFSFAQMVLYGSTLAQAGYTLGILMVHINQQHIQISKDSLTGVDNRREYEYALDSYLRKKHGSMLIAMIDVDDFKQINDRYGHAEGDQALKNVAFILKSICDKCHMYCRLTVYRYGGDEFILISSNYDKDFSADTVREILEETETEWNKNSETPYELYLSLGAACGTYQNKSEFEKLIVDADREMYRVKKAHKAGR